VHPPDPVEAHRSRAGWLALQLYTEFCTPDSASSLSIEGFSLALLGELARQKPSAERRGARPRWLRRAVERIDSGFLDSLSLTALAADVQIDPTHLARTFRQHYGCTMTEYVRRLRIEYAKRELLATSRPLSELALAAGFTDQAHFSRVFRQLTGLTPGAFRRAATGR
jgi:AraC family transcriptional regulator